MTRPTESIVEDAALGWLADFGYSVLRGPGIALGEPATERSDPGFRDVLPERRLSGALARLNPQLPAEAPVGSLRRLVRESAWPDRLGAATRRRHD